jgi:nucleoid-associated protein YgaU
MEQLEQATFAVYWKKNELEEIPVKFNPTELTMDKSAQFNEIAIPGLDSPLQQFVRGQAEKLTLELFFDSTEDGMGAGATSVTTYTDRIYSLVKIEPETHAPPVCGFFWNEKFPGVDTSENLGNQKRNHFQCTVENIKQKFTLFSPEGVPLRATLTVTLREYKTLDEQLHQLNLTSPDRTHVHVVQRGDTLSSLAAEYYRRPGEWRHIADKNDIEDPRRQVTPGIYIKIPPIT